MKNRGGKQKYLKRGDMLGKGCGGAGRGCLKRGRGLWPPYELWILENNDSKSKLPINKLGSCFNILFEK